MNYDSWKLASGQDSHAEALAERCDDIEAQMDGKLGRALEQANASCDWEWSAEPALAEPTDDVISLELNLRLRHLPVTGSPGDLRQLALAVSRLAQVLTSAAQANASPSGLKLAPSVTERPAARQSETG